MPLGRGLIKKFDSKSLHKFINMNASLNVILVMISTFCFNINTSAQINKKHQSVKLTVLNSMERIGQNQPLFGSNSIVIKGAKNEVESFQIVVHALQKNIVVVKAEMSDLVGSTGSINKKNISLFREEFTRVGRSTPLAALPPGLYADPLIPFINPQTGKPIEPRNDTQEKVHGPIITKGVELYPIPFEVWSGQNQPLWVDISIPKDAPAGEYKGKFTITVYDSSVTDIPKNDGMMIPSTKSRLNSSFETVYSVPCTLTVWDFTLPDGPTHRNNFQNVQRASLAFGLSQNSDEFKEIEMSYCRMMADNHINPPIPARFLPETNDDGSLKITSERTEVLKKYIQDFHVTDFQVPWAPFKDVVTLNRDKAIRYYKEFYQYLKSNGWDKRAYLYMLDEPNTKAEYERVLALGSLVHEAAPELKRLVVEQPYKEDASWPDLDQAVDIWCPLFSFIDRDAINGKLAHGDEIWSYTALSQRAPMYHPKYNEVKNYDPPYWAIDQPLTSYRMATWINWQYKINGFLYWQTVNSNKTISGVMDPWFLPTYSELGSHFNGEGYLMYPGVPSGINGPIASMRLKNIRDSMEDYEFFALLEKLSNRETVTKIISTIVPNWWAKPNAENFITVREKIANEILKLQKIKKSS